MGKWVFMNRRAPGKGSARNQWSAGTFRSEFKRHLRAAKLKVRPAKNMRHTFATLHIAAGEDISFVSKTMGHTDVEITLKRYNKYIPNHTRQDGSAFEKAINGS